jgi:hypothetical protein
VHSVDLGKSPLEIKDALHCPERTVEDRGPDLEGVALQPVAGDDPVPPGAVESAEVTDPHGLHRPQSLHVQPVWGSCVAEHRLLVLNVDHPKALERGGGGELFLHFGAVADLRGGEVGKRSGPPRAGGALVPGPPPEQTTNDGTGEIGAHGQDQQGEQERPRGPEEHGSELH